MPNPSIIAAEDSPVIIAPVIVSAVPVTVPDDEDEDDYDTPVYCPSVQP